MDSYIIDMLTQDSVSILTIIDGVNHRKAYINSASGRLELAELPQDTQTEILTVWGETPTIVEIAESETNSSTPVTTMTNDEITDYLADLDCRLVMLELGL